MTKKEKVKITTVEEMIRKIMDCKAVVVQSNGVGIGNGIIMR